MKCNSGFTLVEVLVALAVLAISMVGIFSLTNEAINISAYSRDRLFLVDKGYERILKTVHYPRVSLGDKEEDPIYGDVEFEFKKSNTLLPNVSSVYMKIKIKKASVGYEYFEKN